MSRRSPKRRKGGGDRFLQLFDYMLATEAWRTLPPAARSVLLELARRYDGTNNGRIALSVRDAARLAAVNKDTAAKCFLVLVDRGFIECAHAGLAGRQVRIASEWRLTWQRCDKTHTMPSKAFRQWSPPPVERRPRKQIVGPKRGDRASETRGQNAALKVSPVRIEGTVSRVTA